MSDLHLDDRLAAVRSVVDAWVQQLGDDTSSVRSIEHGTVDGSSLGEPVWVIRLAADAVETVTVWLRLGQRTLRYETYLLPVPPDRVAAVAEYLIRENNAIVGAHFSIGTDNGVYLRGELPDGCLTLDELDRIVGTLYEHVERRIETLARMAFADSASNEPRSHDR